VGGGGGGWSLNDDVSTAAVHAVILGMKNNTWCRVQNGSK
jgi:hypothetical protein